MSGKYIVFNKDSCWDFSGIDYRSEVSKLSARSILGIVLESFSFGSPHARVWAARRSIRNERVMQQRRARKSPKKRGVAL